MSVVAGLKSKVNNYRATQASRATAVEMEYQPDMPHIKEGWMAKKGGVGGQKMWKKRWFVLTTEFLIYCSKQAAPVGPNVKGQVKLCDAYLVETSATKRELCFQLCTPDRTYYFEPLSNTDRAEWIRKLKACLDKRLDTASVLRSGFLMKLGGKVGPLMSSKMIPSALKSPKMNSPLQEEKSKGLMRDSQKTKWQKRFFVLRMGELCYYVQQRDIFPPEKRKGTILLRGSYIVAESNADPAHPNAFELIAGDRSYTLDIGEEQGRNMFSNNGDERCATKAEWISSLLYANPSAVFGVPLAVAATRSNGGNTKALVPAPITMATQWLNSHALREEGLYRIPGSKAEVEKFIRKYDSGEAVTVPENYFGGNLASLVVQFIRRCPENLFTEEFAPLFEKIVGDFNSGVDPAKQLHMLKRLVGMLPPVNLATIRCLLEHLLQVAALSEENHMTSDKLSMCVYAKMAPTIGLCMSKYEDLFGSLETNVGLETTNDVARLVEETEQKAARERQARQEKDEREEIARLKKLGMGSPSLTSASEADDSDDELEGKSGSAGGLKCSCGSIMEDFAVFCGDCGKPVEKKTPNKAEVKTEKKVATNTRRGLEFGELKCPACGAAAEPGTTFCDQCGGKIPSLDSLANSPKASQQPKREDSPAPRKQQQQLTPSTVQASSPNNTNNSGGVKRSGSNSNFNKYPLSPFQPERERVATLETINTPVMSPAESMTMLEALKTALPNKADKWADWVAKLSSSGINNVGDLKAMEVERLASLDCPALLKSVLNRIRSGDPMPASRASDAAPLKCACGETNVAGAAYCEKCGSKIQPLAAGPRFSFSVPQQPRPTVSASVAASAAKNTTANNTNNNKASNAPPPPPFSGNAALPATTTSAAAAATSVAATTAGSAATKVAPASAAAADRKCPSCNTVCEPSTAFCEQCGTRLGPAKQPAPAATAANATTTATSATTNATRTPGRLTSFTPASSSPSPSPSPSPTSGPATTASPTVGPNVNRPFAGRTVTSGPNNNNNSRPTVSRTGPTPTTTTTNTTTTPASTTTTNTNTAATTTPATTTPAATGPRTTITAGNAVAQRLNAFSVSGGLKCGSCGEPHAAGAAFCDQCGNKLGGASPSPAARWSPGAARTGPSVSTTTTTTATATPTKTWGNNNTNNVASRFTVAAAATSATTTTSTSATTARPTLSSPSTANTNAFNKPPASPTAGARPTISSAPSTTTTGAASPAPFGRLNSAASPASPVIGRTAAASPASPKPAPAPAPAPATAPAPAPASPASNKPSPAPAPRPSVAGLKCPSCGKTAPPGDAFCDQCGAKLSVSSPSPSPSPAVAPLVRAPSAARRVQSPFLK